MRLLSSFVAFDVELAQSTDPELFELLGCQMLVPVALQQKEQLAVSSSSSIACEGFMASSFWWRAGGLADDNLGGALQVFSRIATFELSYK
jgi:hypothetical protein